MDTVRDFEQLGRELDTRLDALREIARACGRRLTRGRVESVEKALAILDSFDAGSFDTCQRVAPGLLRRIGAVADELILSWEERTEREEALARRVSKTT